MWWQLILQILPYIGAMFFGAGASDAVQGMASTSSVAFWAQTAALLGIGASGMGVGVYSAAKSRAPQRALMADVDALNRAVGYLGECDATEEMAKKILCSHRQGATK